MAFTPPHDRNWWNQDQRPIIAAKLPAHPFDVLLSSDGFVFDRFERNGEMASIAYLRATRNGFTIEAPLSAWAWVEFGESPAA